VSEEDWIAALPLDELPDAKPTRVNVEGADVLLVRDGARLFAIANRCTHQGAPLHKGPARFSGSLATVTCPVHGSQFALETGKVLRGPAMAPVSAYDVRVNGDVVQIRDKA